MTVGAAEPNLLGMQIRGSRLLSWLRRPWLSYGLVGLLAGAAPSSGGSAREKARSAKDAAAVMVNGFNVGNTFELDQHPRTPEFVDAIIDAYYAEGFRQVRVPVRWLHSDWGGEPSLADETGKVDRSHPRLAALSRIIDHAIDKGMYVVVDAHHEDWLFDNDWSPAQLATFQNLWRGVCDVFKDKDRKLIFEVLNEPHGRISDDSEAVRALNKSAYDIIRHCGGKNDRRIIIIDGQNWGSPASLRLTWPKVTDIPGGGRDPNLIGSIHFYDPLTLTHAPDADGIEAPWSPEKIESVLDGVATWADGRLPIYVGEFGVNWNQHAHRINDNVKGWYAAVAAAVRSRRWAFAVWDDGGWFRVMDRKDHSFDGLQKDCVP